MLVALFSAVKVESIPLNSENSTNFSHRHVRVAGRPRLLPG